MLLSCCSAHTCAHVPLQRLHYMHEDPTSYGVRQLNQRQPQLTLSLSQDDVRTVRRRVALVSPRAAGVFRATAEDNVAVSATHEVRVCMGERES